MSHLDLIVEHVLTKNFKTEYLRFGKKDEYEITDKIDDTKKELKNIFTDFVIKEFYVTPLQSDSMVKLIFENYYQAISTYIKKKGLKENDIVFIYKGGNV